MGLKSCFLTIICCLAITIAFGQHRSDSIHVAHYELNLFIDPFGSTLDGTANLQLVPKISNLSHFDLDLKNLTVDSIHINGQSATFTHHGERLSIDACEYAPGDTLLVAVDYHGTPFGNASGGLNFSNGSYYNLGVNMNEQPHCFGRAWFPCIDEFTDKSSYNFNIETYPYHTAVCGGELLGCDATEDGFKVWHWQLDQPIPTYLASIATGPYLLYADTFHGMEADIPITIYATSSYISNIPGSFGNLKEIAANYERLFGPLRFNRIGYVLVNNTGFAMEHATNITYPQLCVNGTISYQSLYAHEFSHSWFGNLVTCENAENMWINEGFASYSEALTDEGLYSKQQYTSTINQQHAYVLHNLFNDDHGYYALNNVPQTVTYGTHSYDKGAIVIHTLRHYLGDSLFFKGLKSYLNQYAFQNINSEELFDFFSQSTGVDLNEFYEGWINQAGFPHFSIDSIVTEGGNQYAIYVRQRLFHAPNFINDNKVNLTFFSNDNQRFDITHFNFSGEYGIAHIELPFAPAFGVVDYSNEICDAIIDYNKTIKTTGNSNFTEAKVNCYVSAVQDSSIMRIEYNFVNPDPQKSVLGQQYHLHNRYWRIEYTNTDDIAGCFRFNYNASNSTQSEYELLQGHSVNDLVLLYRRDCADDWQAISFTRSGQLSGTISTDSLRAGEYVLAVPDEDVGIQHHKSNTDRAEAAIRPNPSHDFVTIDNAEKINKIEIFDINGKKIQELAGLSSAERINIQHLIQGTYIFKVYQQNSPVQNLIFIKND